ncbi:MAG: alpha/beta hydrolase [Myxococcota bacterium]
MIAWLATVASAVIVQTPQGPVDVRVTGEGPAVIAFHGSPGGSDQGRLLDPLAQAGFTVVTMSRPGYLGTPLEIGPSFDAQADVAAALLDTLGIDRAAALGMSAGGPVALAFATRHPDRAWALVLEAAVVDAYVPSDLAKNKLLGRLILSRTFGGPTFRSLRRSMLRKPERSARRLLKIESTLDKAAREACASAIALDPEPWSVLADSFVPYRDRRRGLRNDLDGLAAVDAGRWRTLSVPTLMQYSPSDADVPLAHAEALLAEDVEATLVLHEEACGHLLWFGPSAEPVADARVQFLRQHQP